MKPVGTATIVGVPRTELGPPVSIPLGTNRSWMSCSWPFIRFGMVYDAVVRVLPGTSVHPNLVPMVGKLVGGC